GVWHSNDATTSTIADSTANGNNGTKKAANEPIEADGKIGKAQSYDETNDYVNVGTAVSGLSDYTLTAWIKTSKTEDSTIIGNYDASYNYWMIIDNGGDIQLYSGTWLSGDNFKSITDNNWHFIVGSRSGTTGYLYIDGQLDKTGNVGSAITSSLNTYLGRNPGGTNPFGGIIDEMRISSSARSAPWIAAEYKNQTDIFNTIDSEKTPIETTGTYSSIAKDMAFNTNLTLFNTSQTLNGGTASYSIRTGPVSVPDGTWTGWVAVTPGADPSDTLDNNRYAQVKVDLTGTGSATPDINSFTLSYFSVPGTSVISTPADGSSFGAGDVAIAGTATSNSGASMVRVEVSTDGGTTWNNATGTDNWTYTFVSPPSGIYNIKSRVYNSDNVYETAGAGINITVDADQPTSAINYPVNGSGYYSPNLLVAGTSSDTGGGNVSKVEIKVTKGGTTIKDWTQATNTGTNFSTWSYSQNSILEDDQTYLIESRATDNFGNVQTTLGSSTITVDLTYPSSSVTSPKDGDKFKVEDRKIDGTATTNNGQALSKIEVRIMKLGDIAQKTTAETTGKIVVQDWTAGSGLESWSYIIPNSLFIIHGGGYYQIQSRATNIVSFVESPSPGITILVDDKPPTVPSNPILQDITNYSEGINALFLQFDVSKDNETLVKEYEISVNGKISKLQVQGVNEKQSSAEPISIVLTLDQGVKEGANSVSIKAKDEVDNTSDSSKTASVEIKKQSGNITDIEIKNITLVKKQGDDEKTSALVQYKTSIPASTIVYWDETNPEGSGAKAYSEPSLNYNHTAIVDNLTPDTNFKVKIEGIDEYGNQIESAVQSFKSTPKPEEESILRIIIKALEDLFSWAKKVMAAPFSEKKNLAEETKNYLSLKTIDTSEKLSADKTQTGTTKTSLVALSFRKGSVLVKENMSLTGNGLKNIFNTNLQSQVLKTNILDSNFGIALDKSPEPGKKVIYKLDKIDQSAKVLVPGAENQLVPEIKDIETKEIITTKEKAEYLVIFKTDIPAKAEILAGERKITEENNNLSHSFYLDSLNPGDTIKYKLTVLGPYGTTKESDEQSFTVPKPEQQKTIWQIIIDALISSFDWLKNILK
ncbi:MAG: hypothetical protein NT039_02675, partial [Candidatus Berkelbacteria bacterium]|nr:hypothetical protein [Candidatus Berkelbacteria bacterium]